MSTIDIHNHIVPAEFPIVDASCAKGQWPSLRDDGGGEATIMVAGKEFRRIDSRSWDVARRIADLNEERVDMQVISPMPELLSYGYDPVDTSAMARHINQAIAEMVTAAPERFLGMGMVALQDPDLAAHQLSHLRDELNFVGVEIGSNINGKVPGDHFFEPFFAEAERLGMAIFVHARHPAATDRLVGPPMVQALVGFPTEIGLSAASVITSGLIERHPNLRIAFSHGGGTLAAILPRLNHGWKGSPAFKHLTLSPFDAARRMFYDTLVFDHEFLIHLIDRFGSSQIMIGTDYPYTLRQSFPGKFVDELGLDVAILNAIKGGNARRFLDFPK